MDALKGFAQKAMSGNSGNTQTGSTDPNVANTGATGQTTNDKGDFLDQGVGMAGKHFGQNLDRQSQEKYSDGIRSAYTKATGSDVPIKDKN